MARRVIRLQENIARSKEAAETSEKVTIKANALKRIEAYEIELAELKAKLEPAPATDVEGSKGTDEK